MRRAFSDTVLRRISDDYLSKHLDAQLRFRDESFLRVSKIVKKLDNGIAREDVQLELLLFVKETKYSKASVLRGIANR